MMLLQILELTACTKYCSYTTLEVRVGEEHHKIGNGRLYENQLNVLFSPGVNSLSGTTHTMS